MVLWIMSGIFHSSALVSFWMTRCYIMCLAVLLHSSFNSPISKLVMILLFKLRLLLTFHKNHLST